MRNPVLLALTVMLAACGGGSTQSVQSQQPPPVYAPVDLRVTSEFVVKVRSNGTGWVALVETAQQLATFTMPQRRLLLAIDGVTPSASYAPPDGWSLIDVAVHPGRELSVLIANDTQLRLVRLSRQGAVVAQHDVEDPQAASDPFYGDPIQLRNPNSLLPHTTRDAARIAPVGEDLVVAMHNGRNAIIAMRYGYSAKFGRTWRTLVEPGVSLIARFIMGGTYDPYGGLDNQWRVAVDADSSGRVAVAVGLDWSDYADGHGQLFGGAIHPELFTGALITELAADGRRVGTSVLESGAPTEIKVVKWHGDTIGVAGRYYRVRRDDGGGWDGLFAQAHAGAHGKLAPRAVDIDRGDVILDLAPVAGGRWLAAGSTGYTQNPSGASISEEARPLLALLESDGAVREQIAVASGLRHNQLRSLTPFNNGWLAGGMENGPGTHSADGNLSLLKSDGFVRAVRLP